MFDRLDDILIRYQQIMEELNDPDVVNDQKHFRKLMKEQSDLQPLVEKYTGSVAFRLHIRCNSTRRAF